MLMLMFTLILMLILMSLCKPALRQNKDPREQTRKVAVCTALILSTRASTEYKETEVLLNMTK